MKKNGHVHKDRLPVLIVKGFAPFPVPNIFKRFYQHHGYDIHVIPYHFPSMRDVRTYAARVREKMEAMAERFGHINVIGFSMGGVAALHALKRMKDPNRVVTFVSYGAPFYGTPTAVFALPTLIFTRVGLQLGMNSNFLAELHDAPLPDGPRIIAVGGDKDRLCPVASSQLERAHERHIVKGYTHNAFLVDAALHAILERHLLNRAFPRAVATLPH